MDGFFRILEKTSFQLICTRLYIQIFGEFQTEKQMLLPITQYFKAQMRLTFMMIVLLHGYFGRNHSVCSEYEGSKSKHKFYTAQRTEAKFSDKVATEPMYISLKTLYNITILKGKKYINL